MVVAKVENVERMPEAARNTGNESERVGGELSACRAKLVPRARSFIMGGLVFLDRLKIEQPGVLGRGYRDG